MSQVDMDQFRRAAERDGISLSAWLRGAGLERLRGQRADSLRTPDDLRRFFEECARREADQGHEPGWEQHRRAIDASRSSGQSST